MSAPPWPCETHRGSAVARAVADDAPASLAAVASLEGKVRPRGQEKPKGSLQWISEGHAVKAEVRVACCDGRSVAPAYGWAAAGAAVQLPLHVREPQQPAGVAAGERGRGARRRGRGR